MLQRRDFIKQIALGSLCLGFPSLLSARSMTNKTVILLELSGGNDGLNTVIPYADPLYYTLRKNIAIPKEKIIPINEHLGFHPSLEGFSKIFQSGDMAILQGVGYPDPNRSHFRSIEIWESASDTDTYLDSGWITDTFLHNSASHPIDGIIMGKHSQGPLFGQGIKTVDINDPDRFIRRSKHLKNPHANPTQHNHALTHLLNVQREINTSRELFSKKLIPSDKFSDEGFAKDRFSKELYQAARVIVSDLGIPVIKISLGGFDTHSYQLNHQAKLLEQLDIGLSQLRKTLKQHGKWEDTLILTYGEFGRRVAENASRGTDHGKANVHFALGGKVKGGIYGKHPRLDDLDNGDLRYSMDFRSIDKTIVEDWWGYKTTDRLRAFKKVAYLR